MKGEHRARRLLALAVVCLVFFVGRTAWAQRVLLVRPSGANETLSEAFSRLRGELGLHGFEVVVVDAQEAPAPDTLSRSADEGGAVASVSFIEQRGETSVDVWVSDRVTGKTSLRTISTDGADDAASLLALRATELLRASLREYAPRKAPPPDIRGASPERADETVTDWVRPDEPRFWLGGGALVVASFPDVAVGGGPEIALGVRGDRWGARLTLAGPALGVRFEAPGAEARLRLLTLLAEPSYAFVAHRHVSVAVVPAAGVAYIGVEGDGQLPIVGRKDSAWVGAFGGGLEVTVRAGNTVRAFVASRALGLLPEPFVEVGEAEPRAGRPLWISSAGLRVAF